MKSRIVFICVLITTLLALPLWSQLTTGPVSPYYIVSLGGIYVVQGTNPVWSFPTVYGGDENVLAITCAWTSSCTSVFGTGSIHTRTDGFGPGQNDGEYALSGTQTGVSYYVPPGLVTYDGTSDGLHNYYVGHTYPAVFVADPHWQNERLLFDQALLGNPTGITYDPFNHSLWLSDAGSATVADFSLNGTLLSSFNTFDPFIRYDNGNTALAFDSADGTLWMVKAFDAGACSTPPLYKCMTLQQWTTDGMLLQSGLVDGLPDFFWTSGEMPEPEPEPTTILLFGSGVVGLGAVVRRRLHL